MILVLVLIFTKDSLKQDKLEYEKNLKIGKFVAIHGFVSLIQIIIAFTTNDNVLKFIANINGLLSTLLTFIKYAPQIYTTYTLKHPGTLSIGMMCIQTPGGAIFTATLFFTKGSHWSSWISYFAAFILQGILLSLCIYYEYFRKGSLNAENLERIEVERIMENNLDSQDSNKAVDIESIVNNETSPLIETQSQSPNL